MRMEDIIKELSKVNGNLFSQFGNESYLIRTQIFDICERLRIERGKQIKKQLDLDKALNNFYESEKERILYIEENEKLQRVADNAAYYLKLIKVADAEDPKFLEIESNFHSMVYNATQFKNVLD